MGGLVNVLKDKVGVDADGKVNQGDMTRVKKRNKALTKGLSAWADVPGILQNAFHDRPSAATQSLLKTLIALRAEVADVGDKPAAFVTPVVSWETETGTQRIVVI
jgi:hypothetical protein